MKEATYLLEKAEQLKVAGKHAEAIAVCEQVLADDAFSTAALEEIGDNYISLRDVKKAEKALKRALQLNPDSANAWYLMGFLHSCVRKWKESLAALERADELRPNHPEVLRCLGWTLFCHGDKARGKILLERARALSPNDIFILTDLGVCFLQEHETSEAAHVFRKILQLDPENKKARECLAIVDDYLKEAKKLGRSK